MGYSTVDQTDGNFLYPSLNVTNIQVYAITSIGIFHIGIFKLNVEGNDLFIGGRDNSFGGPPVITSWNTQSLQFFNLSTGLSGENPYVLSLLPIGKLFLSIPSKTRK